VTQSKVQQQLVGSSKAQAALIADVRPSFKMNELMLLQTLRLRELTAAILALKRLVAGVVAHVGRMLRRQEERLGTQAARIRALVGVNALMRVEVIDARETFATCVAGVRTLVGVSTNVQVQIANLRKHQLQRLLKQQLC